MFDAHRIVVVVAFSALLGGIDPSEAQQIRSQPLPTVWVLATGGTIASSGASPTSLTAYKPGSVLATDLLKAVPEVAQYAEVKVDQLFNISSSDLTLDNWLTLAHRINAIFTTDPSVAGIVVTHGTNSLEETAYFLNLTVRHDRPVVVTGSMRPSTAMSADGPLNLLNAIRTAISPDARGKGVLVVTNDEINAARDVTKTNTYRVETFQSPELGFLGYVDADKVTFYRASTRRHTSRSEFDLSQIEALPKVDVLYSYIQPNTDLIGALVASGVKGIVFAGMGAGGMTATERSALKAVRSSPANAKLLLVRSSRVGNGRVIALTGLQQEYDALDVIPADNLSPQKARVLLMLALTKTDNLEEIRRMFAEY